MRKNHSRYLVNQFTEVIADNTHICFQLLHLWIQMSHNSPVASKQSLQNMIWEMHLERKKD